MKKKSKPSERNSLQKESDESFGLLADQMPQFIWLTTTNGLEITYSNSTFLNYLGLEPRIYFLGAILETYLHPDDLDEIFSVYGQAFEEKKNYRFEGRVREASSGEYRWHMFLGIPRLGREGEFLGYIGTGINISDRKKAEQELRESEERFRTMAEGTDILIAVADEKSNAIYFNKAWLDLTGRPLKDLLKYGWADLLHPDDRAAYLRTYLQAFDKKESFTGEYRVLSKAGSYRWLLSRAPPRFRPDGSFAGYISSSMDITDRKLSEEGLKAQEVLLEDIISTRTAQLQQSNEDLQQFVHVTSHDLKEPVRKIKVYISRILYEMEDSLPEKAKLYLDKIQSAAGRVVNMIEGVLNYSILQAGAPLVTAIDLNEVLQNIKTDLEILIEQKEAGFLVGELPEIEGVPIMIYQLFYNLIINSLKFTKAGAAPLISISTTLLRKNGKDFVQVEVKDDGIGFKPEQANRIFNTFVRLHPKDKYEGTGLGLALCKKIAEWHHGSIGARSAEGQGATFIVTLPIKQ